MRLLLVGTWTCETDGYEVRRFRRDGSLAVTEKIRDRPITRDGKKRLKRPDRWRKAGSYCAHAVALEDLAASLADRRDVRVALVDALLESHEQRLVAGRLETIPAVVLYDEAADKIVKVWPVRNEKDLDPGRFSKQAVADALMDAARAEHADAVAVDVLDTRRQALREFAAKQAAGEVSKSELAAAVAAMARELLG